MKFCGECAKWERGPGGRAGICGELQDEVQDYREAVMQFSATACRHFEPARHEEDDLCVK